MARVTLYPLCIVCRHPVIDGRCYGTRDGYVHVECNDGED